MKPHAPCAAEFLGGPLDGEKTYATSDEVVKVTGTFARTASPTVKFHDKPQPCHVYVRVRRRDGERYHYLGIRDR